MKDISSTGLPAGKIPQIRVPATLAVSNKGGNIFGGWIMSQVDIAGSIPAGMRARGRIVTRAVTSFEFKKPVFIGDLLSCYAEIVREGRTSMSVYVEVYVQRMHDDVIECIKVTEATVVYVAIDSEGRPKALPPEQ